MQAASSCKFTPSIVARHHVPPKGKCRHFGWCWSALEARPHHRKTARPKRGTMPSVEVAVKYGRRGVGFVVNYWRLFMAFRVCVRARASKYVANWLILFIFGRFVLEIRRRYYCIAFSRTCQKLNSSCSDGVGEFICFRWSNSSSTLASNFFDNCSVL